MLRAALISTALIVATAAPVLPAAQQAAAAQPSADASKCSPARRRGGGLLGALGRVAASSAVNSVLGSNPVTSTISSFLPVEDLLDETLLKLLCKDEQKKAAKATEDVTIQAERTGGNAKVEWQSESRKNVKGRSEVTGFESAGTGGGRCMKVRDVVIIDGEETKMEKRMCKQPPKPGYAMVK